MSISGFFHNIVSEPEKSLTLPQLVHTPGDTSNVFFQPEETIRTYGGNVSLTLDEQACENGPFSITPRVTFALTTNKFKLPRIRPKISYFLITWNDMIFEKTFSSYISYKYKQFFFVSIKFKIPSNQFASIHQI